MAVQVRVRTTVVGAVEVELATASFGRVDVVEEEAPESPVQVPPVDRVLELDSSVLAPGLSLQLA